jgi:nucleoside-diphosphate-sugar epimerase
MVGSKVLVIGATGPAGICLLRECLFRNHETVAFVRNPSKIPPELASNKRLTVSHRPFPMPSPAEARYPNKQSPLTHR